MGEVQDDSPISPASETVTTIHSRWPTPPSGRPPFLPPCRAVHCRPFLTFSKPTGPVAPWLPTTPITRPTIIATPPTSTNRPLTAQATLTTTSPLASLPLLSLRRVLANGSRSVFPLVSLSLPAPSSGLFLAFVPTTRRHPRRRLARPVRAPTPVLVQTTTLACLLLRRPANTCSQSTPPRYVAFCHLISCTPTHACPLYYY